MTKQNVSLSSCESEAPISVLGLGLPALTQLFASWGEPAYRARQLIRWLHKQGQTDFYQMTNFSRALREKLATQCVVSGLSVIRHQRATDGTQKWLFRLSGGNAIETVYIPDGKRATLCISSQVGCALNCSFCSTGKEGFNRNLTAAEIVGQVWTVARLLAPHDSWDQARPITNVVLMGMGEPLLNYEAVVEALSLLLLDDAYGLSKNRVTLSTSGLIPAMERLKTDSPVALAVSLHAPNDALRNQLVPLNKKYPLADLISTCRDYFPRGSKRKVTFEYVMLAGVNDQSEHARQLIKLLAHCPCKMNLIPFNPFPGTQYQSSSSETIDAFQRQLMGAGIDTRVRRTRGEAIDAACGQLAAQGQVLDITGRHARWRQTGRLVPLKLSSSRKVTAESTNVEE